MVYKSTQRTGNWDPLILAQTKNSQMIIIINNREVVDIELLKDMQRSRRFLFSYSNPNVSTCFLSISRRVGETWWNWFIWLCCSWFSRISGALVLSSSLHLTIHILETPSFFLNKTFGQKTSKIWLPSANGLRQLGSEEGEKSTIHHQKPVLILFHVKDYFDFEGCS